jgi:hypothetical protein
VSSVWFSLLGFHVVQLAGAMYHHLRCLGLGLRLGLGLGRSSVPQVRHGEAHTHHIRSA